MNCDICNKKIPKSVFERHMELRHTVRSLIDEVVMGPPPEVVGGIFSPVAPISEDAPDRWDFQKTEVCSFCKQEQPSLLMPYHLNLRHGI